MIEELEKLIEFIQKEYNELTNKWENSEYYSKVNWKNTLVCNILEDKELLDTIISYRDFINENIIQLLMDFKQFNTDAAKVNIRAKAKNSIEYKIENEQIMQLINTKYKNLKCIDSSKKDNFTFQWELQVWNKVDEINNIRSHEKYKQDYVRWENENKGGNG